MAKLAPTELPVDVVGTLIDADAEVEKSEGRAPKPPAEEQRGRLHRAREAMAAHGLDALLVYGSATANADPIRYLAGYVHVFPGASSLLLLPLERDPILLIDQPWHVAEAGRMSWIGDVRSFPNPDRRWLADELQATLGAALADVGVERGRIGIFAGTTPAVYRDVLGVTGPAAALADGSAVWQDLVAAPSAYDAAMIRRAAAVADEGMAAAVETAGAGVPEYEVCLESLRRMASLGAEFLHGSGMTTHVNIGSFSEAISNVRPFLFSTRALERGQMFWLDLSASYAGCYVDTDRTLSVGEPSSRQRELYAVAAEMYGVLLENARAGVTGGELWERATDVARAAGYGDYSNHVYLGHTTGITTSSRPVVARGETAELRAGSFLNVEPGIFVPGVGSACIENTLQITGEGAAAINGFGIGIHVVE
ncbi:MAG: Xaa-Pro peptidase family protein [Actinomycetota bacterium]|nr:Xaa-Pro peptidase family protein [Actinomycetota bacterium]